MNLEQLKAEVAAKKEANIKALKERVEIAKLEAQLKLESNEALLNAKVKLQVMAEDTKKMENLITECSEIISSMPILNRKTHENRKWQGSHRYGYGQQVDLCYELATGILYSCQEHRELLLVHTGLSIGVLSDLVEGFGNPSYYSRNANAIVEEIRPDVAKITDALNLIQSELDVIVDTSKITANNIELEYVRAENKANKDLEEAHEAIAEANFSEM